MSVTNKDLRAIPLFAELSDRELSELGRLATTKRCVKNTVIFDEGQVGDTLLAVSSGLLKVVLYGEGGKEMILALVESPGIVGEVALLDGAPRSASVITLKTSKFFQIPRSWLLRTIQENPGFAKKMIDHLIGSLRKTNEQLRINCMYESDRQVLRRLFLSSGEVALEQGRLVLRRSPSLTQLAQMIGCSRETVSRTMGELEKARYIKTRKQPGGRLIEVVLADRAVNTYLQGLPLPSAHA